MRFTYSSRLDVTATAGPTRIAVLITGNWIKGGREISFSREDLERAVRNFKKLANRDINVDYDHACEDLERARGQPTPSAGSISSLYVESAAGGRWTLFGGYNPTERARGMIKAREYRFVSAAFSRDVFDRETGEPQGLTLTSVALTNQPFLDELPEVSLSIQETGGTRMQDLKIRGANGRHIVSAVRNGVDEDLGQLPEALLRAYCASLPGSYVAQPQESPSLNAAGSRERFARVVQSRKEQLLSRDPSMGELEALRLASAQISKEIPSLLAGYRKDSRSI